MALEAHRRHRARVTSLALLCASCGGGGGGTPNPPSPTPPPPSGSVEVTLERAPESAPLLFSVTAQWASSSASVEDWDSPMIISGIPPGEYVVELSDPTPGCDIVGSPQHMVTVVDGETTAISATFTCAFTPVGRIAFNIVPAGGDNFDGRVWTVRPDGSELREVSPAAGVFPIWSPDGSRIAYLASDGTHIMNFDGSADRQWNAVDAFRASWSPDGEQLVVREGVFGSRPDIWRANLDGSNLQRLSNDAAVEETPSWSPDGSMIALVKDNDLQLIDTNGSFLISLGHAWDESWPRWSPGGSKLVFAWNPPGEEPEFQIYTVNVDGSNRTQLTFMDVPCGAPAYSPDGTEIVFHCPRSENEFIWRMNADGTNQRLFEEIPGPGASHADWIGP